jgi:hypothetical protein
MDAAERTIVMNVEQFAALKVGDKIVNAMNNDTTGEIVEATDSGVRVVWGERHDRETRFFYSVAGTSWFHWSKVEAPFTGNGDAPGTSLGHPHAGGPELPPHKPTTEDDRPEPIRSPSGWPGPDQ